jgi:hypothetical protein
MGPEDDRKAAASSRWRTVVAELRQWRVETTRAAPKGWDRGGIVRGSRFIARKHEETRKERRFAADSIHRIGEEREKAVRSRRKKKGKGKETLTGGSHMSATRRGNGRALAWRAAMAGLGPRGSEARE